MAHKLPSPRALAQARSRLDDALAEHPDDPTLLLLRGRADARVGQYGEAAAYFERAASGFAAVHDVANEASARLDGATSLSRAGFDHEARAAYHLAIAAFVTGGDGRGTAQTRLALARHELANRQFDSARIELEKCLEPLADAEAYGELGWACERLVELTRRDGDLEEALEHARWAVEAAAKARDRAPFGTRLAMLGILHREADHPAKAKGYLTRALPYLREEGPRPVLLDALVTLAELAEQRGKDQASRLHLEEALEVADRGATVVDRRRVRLQLAAQLALESPVRARRLIDDVMAMMDDGPDDAARATWMQIASVQTRLGEAQAARESLDRLRTPVDLD